MRNLRGRAALKRIGFTALEARVEAMRSAGQVVSLVRASGDPGANIGMRVDGHPIVDISGPVVARACAHIQDVRHKLHDSTGRLTIARRTVAAGLAMILFKHRLASMRLVMNAWKIQTASRKRAAYQCKLSEDDAARATQRRIL